MSLRLRLTLLYTTLLGGVLLLFGAIVYELFNITLISQVDDLIAGTANERIIPAMRVNPQGELDITAFPSLELTDIVFVQLWGQDGLLKTASPNISGLNEPMDPSGLRALVPIFRSVEVQGVSLRVLSTPILVAERQVGVLQIGVNIVLIETTQQSMLIVLIISVLVAMSLGGLAAWLSTGQALARLETVTQFATLITRADDLSQRIPVSELANDEVGQLISAFNQTLSRLEKLFTAQRRFLADVSHELRTPLTVIKGNIGLMRRMKDLDEESLESIEAEVDRLARMVGDLLMLAQAESGKVPLDMRPVELDTVLLEVFQQMRLLAGDKLEMHISDIDQLQVVGDRDRLKQVLLNLVSNAINYTPAGGQVLIGLIRSGDQARLEVADTGPGIPAKDIPHIFDRFYRTEKARTRSRDGSTGFGLGLSIAYWIVHNHGGRIEIDSKEGKGTHFFVWLPLLQQAAPEIEKTQRV